MAVMQRDPVNAEPPKAETIEELFDALESPLLAYALRLSGERGVAEDLVQEAFMKLHSQFAEVREPRAGGDAPQLMSVESRKDRNRLERPPVHAPRSSHGLRPRRNASCRR